ncbi:MAG: RNA-binding cell elongation regulator Jag/EloR [Acidimicrobiales bacterium]
MEWIETAAKTLDEAKDQALDTLGVDETEVEFEVLEEPRQGLFGRVRGEARVRARIAPKAPRAKDDAKRRRRPKKSDDGATTSERPAAKSKRQSAPTPDGGADEGNARTKGAANDNDVTSSEPRSGRSGRGRDNGRDGGKRQQRASGGNSRPKQEESPVEEVTSTVETFLTGLTAAFGIDAPVSIEVEDDHLMASIEGKHGLLLGPKAHTLDAIQELTRVTAQRGAPSSMRIKVDVGGYREARRQALIGFAKSAAERAIDEGVEVVLEPMNAADRKTVHDAINDIDGAVTRSAGTEPRRRVVVGPAESPAKRDEEE